MPSFKMPDQCIEELVQQLSLSMSVCCKIQRKEKMSRLQIVHLHKDYTFFGVVVL